MIAYVGLTRDTSMIQALRSAHIGRMQQRGQLDLRALWRGERWALDNGAFVDWRAGRKFDEAQWAKDIEAVARSGRTPALAVLPDLPTRGVESLRFSVEWSLCLPPAWAWYLAVQNGMGCDAVEAALEDLGHVTVRGLFLGGDDAFKDAEAADWCAFAHDRGLLFHYGRAGTPRRIQHAKAIGADSLDSSFPLWTRDRMARFLRLVGAWSPQQSIEFDDEDAIGLDNYELATTNGADDA